jgi:acyl-CoA oxidase
MLMKYTKVNRDGSVVEPPMAQLAYGALVGGRTTMIQESADFAKKALTIAIRYGIVRRQFGGKGGTVENKILDYGTHKMRLLPAVAITYAMHFAAVEVTRIYDSLMEQLGQFKKPNSASPSRLAELLDTLKETHGTSAGLKAFCSWKALEIIETCRQSCGGQGYSSYAGLASMYQDFAVQCTWEGDNTVMTLQLGRYLVSSLRERLEKKKTLPSGVGYLNSIPDNLKRKCTGDISDPKIIGEAMDVTCANAVMMAAEVFTKLKAQGLSEEEAYEKSSIQRFTAAKLHCYNYIYCKFLDACKRAPRGGIDSMLSKLCTLYGLHSISENAGWFLQFGYLNSGHMAAIQSKILALLDQIRPDAIPLTDAFGLTDYVINSPLGCADGDVYRRIFEKTVQRNPSKPHAYFDKVIKPVLNN